VTDVVVTGIGLFTPAGRGVEQSWEGIVAGKPTATRDPDLVAADVPVTMSCRVPPYDPEEVGRGASRRLDRYTHLALIAAREAVAASGLPIGDDGFDADLGDRVGVILGCGIGGVGTWEEQHQSFLERGRVSPFMIPKMLSNMAAGQVSIDVRARGPNLTVNTACAAGATALHLGRDLLRSGTADVVIAGGAEAGVTPLGAAAFAQMHALSRRDDETASRPFDVDRDGFVMGEGAGILVLERADDAAARGATVLARIAGAGASADAHHQTAPPEDGGGAVLAMQRALRDAGADPADVDHINAHGTSTPLNDKAEALAIRTVFAAAADGIPVTSTKGVTGHLLGAAGAVEAAFSILAIRDGLIPPTANLVTRDPEIDLDVVGVDARPIALRTVLSNSFGFGGQNASLLFTAA
jgi:beta-ketoacyl-acyl-carrier-protein synthase II